MATGIILLLNLLVVGVFSIKSASKAHERVELKIKALRQETIRQIDILKAHEVQVANCQLASHPFAGHVITLISGKQCKMIIQHIKLEADHSDIKLK